ncbi:MAG: hypothetical protein U0K23_05990 [Selenomonadaceae bacterium]|jgi:hypothetical protein|nr:hypothetical protein [Selenomonadaceae bacterium]
MNSLSIIFTLICIGYSAYEIKKAHREKLENVAGNEAQNVISVGVLFTFVGIAISLMYFDTNPETMAQSIEVFLDGMKTAFYTSIVGMMAAIIIKYIQAGVEAKEDVEYRESLENIKAMNSSLKDVVAELKAVRNSTENNTTSDVANNVQLRKEISALNTAFRDFITAYNTSQENVNKKVEEYGESFRQLNASVQDLNKWQSEYKNIVDESIKELNVIQSTFITFQEVVSQDVTGRIIELNETMQTFAKTTKLSVDVQDSLHKSTSSLTEMVALYKANIKEVQEILDKLKNAQTE